MRLERDGDRRLSDLARPGGDSLEDPAVPEMDTVEVPDRPDTAARKLRRSLSSSF